MMVMVFSNRFFKVVKTNKMKIQHILFVLLVGALLTACEKNDTAEPVRLFRPPTGQLSTLNNSIVVSWQNIKGATSYILQVSRDTFRTVDYSFNLDTSAFIVPNVRWNQLYQLQVKALAPDTSLNSKWSAIGAIKVPKFPAWNHQEPTPAQSSDEAIRVNWTSSGTPITSIKVLKLSDSSLVKEVAVNSADNTNRFKIVSGLASSTSYVVYLYSGTADRGWENYTTKAPIPGIIVDLRNIVGRSTVLRDTIPTIPSGSTVLLKRGETYAISAAVSLSKSITIMSGSDLLVAEPANIFFTNNFNFTAGSTIDSIIFKGVNMKSDNFGSRYIFNTTNSATVGKLGFEDCRIEIFRGMVRLQSGTTMISNFSVNNCILDSLSNYGVITVDNVSCVADNISIKNTTIYKAEKIIVSRQNSTSVLIDNCTINEAPFGLTGTTYSYYINYGTSGTNTVTSGITVNNTIFGIGKPNSGNPALKGINASATTNVIAGNNFRTSDQVSGGNDIPGIVTLSKSITQLWQDPANGNFKIIDNSFQGRANSGDPRWRIN
jgi:hypothetical protein